MKECYVPKSFSAAHAAVIDRANAIITEYRDQGFDLTLRQLYYQFVARGVIENTLRSYKRLGSIVNDARLAGEIDWYAIVDRTRSVRGNSHWSSPESIIESCAASFRVEKWRDQEYRVEVWIEKDALIGVIEPACRDLDIDYFACRGYSSQSAQWRAGSRFKEYIGDEQKVVVLHFGDHDPSGVDMTRDNADRLAMFTHHRVEVIRVALNMDQVEQYQPPPNPAKLSDSRAESYIEIYGYDSWELDALEPMVIDRLIREHVAKFRDETLWQAALEVENDARRILKTMADRYDEVTEFLEQ